MKQLIHQVEHSLSCFVGGFTFTARCARIDDKKNTCGSRWKKIGSHLEIVTKNHFENSSQSVLEPIQRRTGKTELNIIPDIGPQCKRDNLLTSRMRKHQSWYRAYELHLSYGTGPDQMKPVLVETC
jgi:hypothetical protein